jgi:hypothetical protein
VQAAKMAGVNRATVFRWVQKDPAFRAVYNAWKHEVTESARARLLRLSEQAVNVVEKALNRGDQQVAMKMLRQLGVMRGRRHGSTEPEVLKLQMELKQKQEQRRAEMGMLNHLLRKAGVTPRDRRRIADGREKLDLSSLHVPAPGAAREGGNPVDHATVDAQTCGAPVDAALNESPSTEDNPLPEQEIPTSDTPAAASPADATVDATICGAPHDLAADLETQLLYQN